MTDRIQIPLETSEGRRGPGSAGDRLMVGIALIALLGGVGILAGKMLDRSDAVALSSGSPTASIEASTPAPTPIPTPSTFKVATDIAPPITGPEHPAFSGWIRALEDLPIRSAPTRGANQIGALAKGEAAYADQVPSEVPDGITWLMLQSGSAGGGMVAATKGSKELVVRYPQIPTPSVAQIMGLVASPDEFITWGYGASGSGAAQQPFMATSADGRRWEAVDASVFGGRIPTAIAFGPAGWLAIANVEGDRATGVLWLWSSSDGHQWQSLGRMSGLGEGLYIAQLVGNLSGYELSINADSAPRQTLLHSDDGLTWTSGKGIPPGNFVRLTATSTGYYAWRQDGPTSGPLAASSADGLVWSPEQGGPSGAIRDTVAVGDRLVAIDADPESGTPRVWRGFLVDGSVSWRLEPPLQEFIGGTVTTLASDGQRAIAFGWQRSTLKPAVWFGEWMDWQRAPLPADAFEGARPMLVAANLHAVVAVASRVTLQADDPIFWWATPLMAWQRTTVPGVSPIGEATNNACPSRPDDILEFMAVPPAKAIACFGRTPFTFTGLAGLCTDCTGFPPGTYTPKWLVGPDTQLTISPTQDSDFTRMNVFLAPKLSLDRGWSYQWVTVTGHYDDPASSTCRFTPDPESTELPPLPAEMKRQCRTSFVVTSVKVVPGP
jgi:hypothetical protein